MKNGLLNLGEGLQGNKANKTGKIGETFIKEILDILKIENCIEELKDKFSTRIEENNKKIKHTPDFVIRNSEIGKNIFYKKEYLILESKYKQTEGSDWEKIESNFGYHEFYYNNIANISSKTVVILTGFWSELQNNYWVFMEYFKNIYGSYRIFDFGYSTKEIFRFANLMEVNLTDNQKEKITETWQKYKNLAKNKQK
ncbi:hypothetical protein [Mycoplasmopsis gallinarum]|uniref:Uncharacterized protein n=1 Tax=Mycoplasmopsis gallinarum TaxID=29557 RepID=A0A168RHG8_9BACT|nr:hypothetical protein [Mycoplasmopsis gallinarum]OAB48992.1 hypothetical protein MGALLINA_03240 [Mycoplasmopsis gallinarum]